MGKADLEVLEKRIAEGEAKEAEKKKKEFTDQMKMKLKKSTFFKDFKKFITKGNVVDMAVGVIVGSAFTAIITALSNGILKPIINWILALVIGTDSLSEVYTFLKTAYTVDAAGEKVVDLANSIYIDWGAFVNAIINFLLVAFTLFVIARIASNVMKRVKARELAAAKEAEDKKKAEDAAKAEAAAAVAKEKEDQLQQFYANMARVVELMEKNAK